MATKSRLDAKTLQSISDWLVARALGNGTLERLVEGLCPRLVEGGLPLARLTLGTHLLHPNHESQTIRWRKGSGIQHEAHGVGSMQSEMWLRSPFAAAFYNGGQLLRRRLKGRDAHIEFPILGELAADGMTDYAVIATEFATHHRHDSPVGMVTSWATDRPGGFRKSDLDAIKRLQPRLALAAKATVLHQIALDVVQAYLGRDAGQRVLRGEIRRAQLNTVRAVLLFCDLRGFTALAQRIDLQDLIALLDRYFDAIVATVQDAGGEVLKFLGDGLLAISPIENGAESEVAVAALDATVRIQEEVRSIVSARHSDGLPALDLDVALHLGEAMYGNVGGVDRLDFTVIGPAVNEASRMEALCDQLGVNVVVSADLVDALGSGRPGRLVPLGRHVLRGIDTPRDLFTPGVCRDSG